MDTLYPVNAVAGAPAYSGRMVRQVNSVFLAGATAARPLGGRSGVRPGTSTTTVTATSTTWTCGPFAGVIDAEAAAEAGPYQFAFDAATTGTMTAANGSNPRVDIIYVQVDDPSEGDATSAPAVRRGYLAGTAAATPVAPAAPARSFAVAQINVPKSGGGAPTVSWVAPNVLLAFAPPYCQMSNVTTMANNTVTTLGPSPNGYVETADLLGWHDASVNPSRITPNLPGRYRVVANSAWGASSTGLRYLAFGFNGIYPGKWRQVTLASTDSNGACAVTFDRTFNGTTDYIEAQVFQTSGGPLSVDADVSVTYLGAA